MTRRSRRRRADRQGLARPFSPYTPLAQPASPRRPYDAFPDQLPEEAWELDSFPDSAQYPPALIGTVRIEPQAPPRWGGTRYSPVAQVRASDRVQKARRMASSPFFQATGVTPQLPARALVCARRTIRREVLFAQRRTGSGAKAPRRNRSKVRC